MKKIAVASLAQESNSFSPIKTELKDFAVKRSHEEILAQFSAAVNIFAGAGLEVATTISAYALPGGSVVKEDFILLANELVGNMPQDICGIWLMLHGAMFVEGIGSGEEYILSLIRQKYGRDMPVAVCMDMHANNTQGYINSVDIVRGYHTAPHEAWDYENCKKTTAKALVRAIAGKKFITAMSEINLRLFGENFMTDYSPAKNAVELSDEIEQIPGVVSATIFVGMAWVDCPHNTLSFVITAEENTVDINALLFRLETFVWQKKDKFAVPAKNMLFPSAIDFCEKIDKKHFYISDSGDNVTAGAVGDNAFCLDYLVSKNKRGYLVAGLYDDAFVHACFADKHAPELHFTIGASKDAASKSLAANFKILAHFECDVENVNDVKLVFAEVNHNHVIITNKRCSFTSEETIKIFAGELSAYKGIIVKLGYLFPELVKNASDYVIALTPGNSCLDKNQIAYKNTSF